jgi:hypothetical protein
MPGISYPRTSGGDYSDDLLREFYRVAKDVIGINSDLFNPDAVDALENAPQKSKEIAGVTYSSLALQQIQQIGVEPEAIAHIIKSIPAVGCESLPYGQKVHYDPAANLSVIVEANGKVGGVYRGKMALMNVSLDLSQLKPVGSTAPPDQLVKPKLVKKLSIEQEAEEFLKARRRISGKVRRMHSEEVIKSNNLSGYLYWSKQSTQDIIESLKPGSNEPLSVTPDGQIYAGNTRVLILQKRGFDIHSLPYEIYRGEDYS